MSTAIKGHIGNDNKPRRWIWLLSNQSYMKRLSIIAVLMISLLAFGAVASANGVSGGMGWTNLTLDLEDFNNLGWPKEVKVDGRGWVFDGGFDVTDDIRLSGSWVSVSEAQDEKEDKDAKFQADFSAYDFMGEYKLPIADMPFAAYVGAGYTGYELKGKEKGSDAKFSDKINLKASGLFGGVRAIADLEGAIVEGYFKYAPKLGGEDKFVADQDVVIDEYDVRLMSYGVSLSYPVSDPLSVMVGFKGSSIKPADEKKYAEKVEKVVTGFEGAWDLSSTVFTIGAAVSF
jgi:hypothetical protein